MQHKPIDIVCTMGTRECAQELHLFLTSLRTFHPQLPVVIGCSSDMLTPSPPSSSHRNLRPYLDDANIRWVSCLDQYGTINRRAMEGQRGVWYGTRHTDFMMEKCNLMELAMGRAARRTCPTVAFLDCDLAHLGPLPTIAAASVVGLSPHGICTADEQLFGRYNAGYVVASAPSVLHEWRRATHASRFYDQASLEDVAGAFAGSVDLIPPQHNYGYWRMFQCKGSVEDEVRRFSLAPAESAHETGTLILYDGKPLRSVHTHFFAGGEAAKGMAVFNRLLRRWVRACSNAAYSAALSPLDPQP